MNIRYIPIRPLYIDEVALTPELLAASGARVSRNNTGIDAIIKLIDPNDPEASTKRIFALADYGHVSIKGLTGGIAIFLEKISLWQIYDLFRFCSCSDGQETSTRYVNFGDADTMSAACAEVGHSEAEIAAYHKHCETAGILYEALTNYWTKAAIDHPELVTDVPAGLQAAADRGVEDAVKKVDRLRRNFVFDRARVVIPMASLNNMVLIQTARQWIETCSYLLSHYRIEARAIGALVQEELRRAIPNLMRHSDAKSEVTDQIWSDLYQQSQYALMCGDKAIVERSCPDTELKIWLPDQDEDRGYWGSVPMLRKQFVGHKQRYLPFGEEIGRCGVRFRIRNLGIAELRDLNRHRPGHKFTRLNPYGIYSAYEKTPANLDEATVSLFNEVREFLTRSAQEVRARLKDSNISFYSYYLLGHQLDFEHTTQLDKFLYTAEIRTGPGVHYKYAEQIRACLHSLYQQLPGLRGLVLEGSEEPK